MHPVDRIPRPLPLIAGGVQHVAAMYAGVVAPPLIIGAAVGLSPGDLALLISASLFTAGIATLLQALGFWKIGSRLPLINGVSFAVVAPVLAIVKEHGQQDALPIIYGATIVGGLLTTLAAPYFGKLTRLFPAVVAGTVITLIGICLLPVAVHWVQGPTETAPMTNIVLALVTLAVILACNRFLTGFANRLALLIGLTAGTLVAWPLGALNAKAITEAPVFSFTTPFHFGAPQWDIAAIVSMCIVMVVVMTESTADMLALGEIVERPTTERTIANGLRADGLATSFSAVFGGFACTAFAQNIGLIALTRMYSRYVVAAAGGVLVLLGLFPVAGAVVALVPTPVLGGAGLVLFGSVAVSGIKTLAADGLHESGKVLTVAIALGVGLVPIVAPDFYDRFPSALQTVLDSGISAGTIAAVVLNLLISPRRAKPSADRATSGTDPIPSTTPRSSDARPSS